MRIPKFIPDTPIPRIIAFCVLSVTALRPAEARTCDPFIPGKSCTSTVDFTSGAHDSIALTPSGTATLHVIRKPAFSTCQASFTPGPLTRSVDTSLTGLLTTLGSLGLFGGNPGQEMTRASSAVRTRAVAVTPPPNPDAQSIEAQLQAIGSEEGRLASILDAEQRAYQLGITGDISQGIVGLNMVWGLTDEATVQGGIDGLRTTLNRLVLQNPEPSMQGLQAELDALNRSIGAYHQKYDISGIPQDWLASVNDRTNTLAGVAARDQDYISDILAVRTNLKQALAQLPPPRPTPPPGQSLAPYPPFTSQDLTIPQFVNSNVGVSISCKDSVTQAVNPTTVTFTAYYTRLPWLDFSAGPLFSLLGRHQVGVASQTAVQSAAGTNPNGTFAVTDQSSFQVIPMAFVEIHPRGFRCWWAKPGDQERRFGYVCTVGMVVGAGPNNASGTTQAEFFEGVSFAIQRVSFLFGFHDGRVEKIGGGYGLGEAVPTTGYTPTISRYFSVRPAFGITYRIPLR